MPRRAEVSFGDLVDAWVALGARTDEARAVVAEMLGFQSRAAPTPKGPATAVPIPASGPISTPGPDGPSTDRSPVEPPKTAREVPLTASKLEVPDGAAMAPRWQVEAVTLEPEQRVHIGFEPPPESLFEPRWTRAILAALCAATSDGVEPDVEALVDRLARGQAVLELPRRQLRTLRMGVHLLLDESESMMPFSRDVEEMVSWISQVVGHDRTQIQRFAGTPLRGAGPGSLSTWRTPYRPPSAGTPVVVISDLGLTRGALRRDGARLKEWLEFAARLRLFGCAAIVLAPVPPSRWPSALIRAMKIVAWDRTTTVSRAHGRVVAEGSR